jgi:polyhydroxyalkanoate synthesis regulator phasin
VSDLITKALLCGLGLASLTKDAIQKTAEDLISQSSISEEEGRKLVEDLHRRAKQAQKALEKKIDEAVTKALKNLKLATHPDKPKAAKRAAKGAAKGRRRTAAKKASSH